MGRSSADTAHHRAAKPARDRADDLRAGQRHQPPARLIGTLPDIESRLAVLVLSAASFLLLSVIFPPLGWWPLSYVCLLPWLVAVCKARSSRFLYFASWLLGAGFFLVNIRWMAAVTLPGYLALCAYMSVFFPIAAWPVRHMFRRRRVSIAITLPMVWVAVEYLRSITPLGFPFLLLGHTHYDLPRMIQISDLVGAYGVSFVIAMINGWATDLMIQPILIWRKDQGTRLPIGSLTTLSVFVATYIYGTIQMSPDKLEPGPTVAVVQHDFPMYVDESVLRQSARTTFTSYLAIARQAVATDPDLIVLPETAIPVYVNEAFLNASTADLEEILERRFSSNFTVDDLKHSQTFGREVRDGYQQLADASGIPIVIGASSIEWKPTAVPPRVDAYNSAYLFLPGEPTPAARYDKVHLVLFGEYVPFRYRIHSLYKWLNSITPWGSKGHEYSLTAGDRFETFRVPRRSGDAAFRAAVPICYEECMPYITRTFVRRGRPDKKNIDVLLTISNDGWFLHSAELEQHLATGVFRAVEHRIPVARSVNTGASAIIQPNGEITARVALSEAKRAEVIRAASILRDLIARCQAMVDTARDSKAFDAAYQALMELHQTRWRGILDELGEAFAYLDEQQRYAWLPSRMQDPAQRQSTADHLLRVLREQLRTLERWLDRPETTPGYVAAELYRSDRLTIYSRWGDWFAQGALALMGMMLMDWLLRKILYARLRDQRGRAAAAPT